MQNTYTLYGLLRTLDLRSCSLLILSVAMSISVQAEKIMDDMNFSQGDWVLIGVPIHNVQNLPVQKELGTFISHDRNLMQQIKQQWDLPLTFKDKCDYHYEIKFYESGKLKRTFLINLFCGTLYDEGLSYKFDPRLFEEIRTVAKPVDWSRITFGNLDLLRKAIRILDDTPEVFWYRDVQPYLYPGYFLIRVVNIPWDANMDTVYNNIHDMVESKVRSSNFYLQEHVASMDGDYKAVKYAIYCDQSTSRRYGPGKYINWRSHFFGKDSVQVVAIGIDLKRYLELVESDDKPARTRTE